MLARHKVDVYRTTVQVKDFQEVKSEGLQYSGVIARVYQPKNTFKITDRALETDLSTYKAIIYGQSDIQELDILKVYVPQGNSLRNIGKYKVNKVMPYDQGGMLDHLEVWLSKC